MSKPIYKPCHSRKIKNYDFCSRPEFGQICPACHQGKLEYKNLLNLVCPHCGREWSGSFT